MSWKERGIVSMVMSLFVMVLFLFGVLTIAVYTKQLFEQRNVEKNALTVTENLATAIRTVVLSPASVDFQDVSLPPVLGSSERPQSYVLRIFSGSQQSPSGVSDPTKPGTIVICAYTTVKAQTPTSTREQFKPLACSSVVRKDLTVKVFANNSNTPQEDYIYELANRDKLPNAIEPQKFEKVAIQKETNCTGSACTPTLCVVSCELVGYTNCKNSALANC